MGNLVVITHENGFVTYYAHCSQLLVQEGHGEPGGDHRPGGSTGRSTGPHCTLKSFGRGNCWTPGLPAGFLGR